MIMEVKPNSAQLVYTLCLLVLASMHQSEACERKQPIKGFTNGLVESRGFLMGVMKTSHQPMPTCVTAIGKSQDEDGNKWDYTVSFQTSENGEAKTNVQEFIVTMGPPGQFFARQAVSGTEKEGGYKFNITMIGAEKNKYRVFHDCNQESGKDGIWVYYSKRITGLRNIDSETLAKIKVDLSKHGFSLEDLQDMDNNNCLQSYTGRDSVEL